MSPIEKEQFIDIVNGLSREDLEIVLKAIPEALLWDELRGRSENKTGIINDISSRLMLKVEV